MGIPQVWERELLVPKHFLTTIREATQDKWTARPSDTAAVTLTLLMLPQGMDKLHVGVSRLFAEIGTKICWSFYRGNISALSVPFDLFVFSDTSSVTPDKSPATGKHTLFFIIFKFLFTMCWNFHHTVSQAEPGLFFCHKVFRPCQKFCMTCRKILRCVTTFSLGNFGR